MLRLLIVDDEQPARRGLKRLIQTHEDVQVVGEAGTLDEAEALTCALRPDAIFLDVEMGTGQSFSLVEKLDPLPAIVFVTAHSTYALRAFEVAALDYLQKPVSHERVAVTLERLRRHREAHALAKDQNGDGTAPASSSPIGRLHVRTANQTAAIPLDTIALLAAEADFTRITTVDARDYLVCRLLGRFEDELPTPPFFRLSRSLIVNVDRVNSIRSHGNGHTLVSLGRAAQVPLGRAASRRLRALFSEQMNVVSS